MLIKSDNTQRDFSYKDRFTQDRDLNLFYEYCLVLNLGQPQLKDFCTSDLSSTFCCTIYLKKKKRKKKNISSLRKYDCVCATKLPSRID